MNDGRSTGLLWLFLIGAIVLAAGLGLRDPWPDQRRQAVGVHISRSAGARLARGAVPPACATMPETWNENVVDYAPSQPRNDSPATVKTATQHRETARSATSFPP